MSGYLRGLAGYWWYRLRWPRYCNHCDKPTYRQHNHHAETTAILHCAFGGPEGLAAAIARAEARKRTGGAS